MGKHDRKSDQSHAPGHFENQGPREQAGPPATDREEQYQRRKDQAPTDTGSRDDKIRQRAHELWNRKDGPTGWPSNIGIVRHRSLMERMLQLSANALTEVRHERVSYLLWRW